MSTLPTVRQTGGLAIAGGPSVLGEKPVRLPTAGKIRPGIKRLTRQAEANPDARRAYDEGVAKGQDWGTIEKAVRQALKLGDDARSPMTPQNTPYFHVCRADFVMPEIADRILDLYGEDRGQGRHLYRFPIVLPVDNWQAVLPHSLKAHKRNELVYWSEYGADGVRYCKMHEPLRVDPQSKRAARPFGGRRTMLRPEFSGRCEPEQCPQYQSTPQQCRLTGSFIFYIPQIPGAGAIELPMTSFYGLQGIRQQLELMTYVRGRISGTHNGQPMFWLTKRQEEVSMLDLEQGIPKRVTQWITTLEGAVDMTALLTAPEEDHDDLVTHAAQVLEGPGVTIEGAATEAEEGPPDDGGPAVKDLQASIAGELRDLRVQWATFTPYANHKFGADWTEDRTKLADILAELQSAVSHDQYLEKIHLTMEDAP
ncbi:MAG: hypothetical protein K2Y51_26185 [Gammaproteobacteria bacterium]|nr:hypothetical protein [Gammaproteobacteria bacterium]